MARRGAGYRIETLRGTTFGHARFLHSARKMKKRCEKEYARCVIRDLDQGGTIDYGRYGRKRKRKRSRSFGSSCAGTVMCHK